MEDSSTKYIRKTSDGMYNVEKWIDGHTVYFGRFSSLLNAQKYRDFLVEHDWDTKYYFKNKCAPLKYIQKTENNTYRIDKFLNGKTIYFGVFPSLVDAQKYRDFLIEHDWDLKYQRRKNHCKARSKEMRYISYSKNHDVFQINKTIHGKVMYFGYYHTLEEAIHERDFYESIDWNMDLIDLY